MRLNQNRRGWKYIAVDISTIGCGVEQLYKYKCKLHRNGRIVMRAYCAMNHLTSGTIWLTTHVFTSTIRNYGTRLTKAKAIAQFPQFASLIT